MPDQMSEPVIIRVFDVVGTPLCVSSADGQLVYDKLAPLLREGRKVAVSFAQIETLISAFLNTSIGQLYGDPQIPEAKIRELLSVRDMAPEDVALLNRVVENAKAYSRDPERFKQVTGQEGDNDSQ
jgi:hypothetical protein